MNDLKIIEKEYFQTYLKSLSKPIQTNTVYASWAGDDRNADQLLELYLSGKKTAGSSILEDFQFCGDPLPNSGDHWIVLDSKKTPKCILKVVKVVQNKFLDVPLEIAIAEGEGDLSLKFWRETHIDFFTPYIEHWGLNNVEDSTIVTEFYEVVYK